VKASAIGLFDRRGLVPGLLLVTIGVATLLSRVFDWTGPAPILLAIGAALLALSAWSSFGGPLLPAGVCLGLGAGFLLTPLLAPAFPAWASILLGLGCGFLFVSAIDGAAGRRREPRPLVPGLILVAIALAGAARAAGADRGLLGTLETYWPAVLIVAGSILIFAARRRA
jgi:hypothetical protein